jgi:hypothetical protein
MRARTIPLLALVAVVALLAAGCGSKKKAAATTTTTAAADTSTTTTTAKASTSTSASGGSLNLANADSSCKAFVAVAAKISATMQAATAGNSDLGASSKAAEEAFKAYEDAAPSEIKADFAAYADAFAQYAKALSGVHLKAGARPTAADFAKIAVASKALSNAALQQHSAHLTAWAHKHCGLQTGTSTNG